MNSDQWRQWVELVLNFITSVAWPAVVLVLLIVYKKAVSRFIDDVTDMTFPGGSAKKGDRQSAELLENVDKVSETIQSDIQMNLAREVPVSADRNVSETVDLSFEQLNSAIRRGVSDTSVWASVVSRSRSGFKAPTLSVIRAFDDFAKGVQLVARHINDTMHLGLADDSLGLDPRSALSQVHAPVNLISVATDLSDFAQRVMKGKIELSRGGADDYVDSCGQALSDLVLWSNSFLPPEEQR